MEAMGGEGVSPTDKQPKSKQLVSHPSQQQQPAAAAQSTTTSEEVR